MLRNCAVILSLAHIIVVNAAHNNTYEPNYIVKQFHRLPHLNARLSRVSNKFDLTVANRPWNDYTHSLVPFPLIMASLGAACMISLLSFLISRSCGLLSKTWLPHDIEDYADEIFLMQNLRRSNGLKNAFSHRRLMIRSFLVCIFAILICNQGIFLGVSHFNAAVDTFDVSLRIIKVTFSDLTTQGEDLEIAGLRIGENLASALPTCPSVSNSLPVLEEYQDSVDAYLYLVSPIKDRCQDFNEYIYDNTVSLRNEITWLVYGVVCILVGIFAMGTCIQSSLALKFGIGVGSLCEMIMIGLVCCELFLMVLVADFCIAPSSNALDLVESRYYGIVSYYSTCEGPNPITVPITNAAISLKILNASISMLAAPGGDCEGNPYLLDCSTSIEYAYTNLTAVEESAACAPIEKQWKDVFNDAVCRDGYDGMYITWTTQCVVCALVFAVLVFASLAYPYFTTNWKSATIVQRSRFTRKSRTRDKYLSTNSSRTADTDDSSTPANKPVHRHQPLVDQDFLFIDDERESDAISFGLDADNDLSQALLRSEDSDDLGESSQRLRFNSGFQGGSLGGGVVHVKPSQGKNFSHYLI